MKTSTNKIDLKRTEIYEKIVNDKKQKDTETYKKFRKELIQSEQKAHERSLEIKRKNLQDYMDYKNTRLRSTFTQSLRRDDMVSSNMMKQTDLSFADEINQKLVFYDDKVGKARKRHDEICNKKSVPKTVYYLDSNNNLVNKIDEIVNNQKAKNEEMKEKCFIRNVEKALKIEKLRTKRIKSINKDVEKNKTTREVKFNTVMNNTLKFNHDFEQFRKNKFKKYNEKAKAIEEQKNFILKEIDKKKKLNLFRYLDQKENFNREKTFYK